MNFDELKALLAKQFPPIVFTRQDTALLLIDMQKLLRGERIVRAAVEKGAVRETAEKLVRDYDALLDASIVQAGKVLDFCRGKDLTTIHVKMESYAGDARDTGRSHRMSNYLIPPGSEWAAWLEETAPLPGEIVLTKTCSGAVTGTMLDLVLRNTGIKNVIVTGYYTDQCVESTIRDLADLGYLVFLVRDATIGSSPKRYQNTLENITGVYCRLLYADQVREYFEAPQPGIV